MLLILLLIYDILLILLSLTRITYAIAPPPLAALATRSKHDHNIFINICFHFTTILRFETLLAPQYRRRDPRHISYTAII